MRDAVVGDELYVRRAFGQAADAREVTARMARGGPPSASRSPPAGAT